MLKNGKKCYFLNLLLFAQYAGLILIGDKHKR